MKPKNLILRCYAEKEADGSFFAICVDLNLAAQAESYSAVRAKLHDQIHDYLEDALGDDKEYIGDLLPRRAPLYFWVKYYAIAFLVWLRRPKDCDNSCQFSEALPLKPA